MDTKLIRISSVIEKTSLSRSSIYEKISKGLFPAPVKFGRVSFWIESEICAVIDAVVKGFSEKEIRALVHCLMEQRKEAHHD